MLRWRLLLGVLFAAVLVGLLVADYWLQPPGVVVVPVVVFVAAMSTAEWFGLLAARGLAASPQVMYPANVLLVMAAGLGAWSRQPVDAAVGQTWALALIAVATIAALADEMRRYRGPGKSLERLGATMLGVVYLGVMLSFLVSLRMVGGGAWGTLAIVSLLVVVKFGDIGAYTVGRLVGRHRMAPTLSPGKTIEGAVGALAMGMFGAWLSLVCLAPAMLPPPVSHTHDVASRESEAAVSWHARRKWLGTDASLRIMPVAHGAAGVEPSGEPAKKAAAALANRSMEAAAGPNGTSEASGRSANRGSAIGDDASAEAAHAGSIGAARVPLAAWRWIVYGLVLSVAGMAGDLAESLIKREAGVKDSSQWMPGFGGVLDLIDSILLSAPAAYWCWSWGLVGF